MSALPSPALSEERSGVGAGLRRQPPRARLSRGRRQRPVPAPRLFVLPIQPGAGRAGPRHRPPPAPIGEPPAAARRHWSPPPAGPPMRAAERRAAAERPLTPSALRAPRRPEGAPSGGSAAASLRGGFPRDRPYRRSHPPESGWVLPAPVVTRGKGAYLCVLPHGRGCGLLRGSFP